MRVLRRVMRYFRPYIYHFILATVSLTILTCAGLMRPKLTEILIDRVIKEGEIALLPWVASGIVAIALVRGVFRYLKGVLTEYVGMNTVRDIRNQLYQHLMGLPYQYYDKMRTGELMSRLTGDVDAIRHFISNAMLELYDCLLTFGVVFVILVGMNWRLTLITLITSPFIFLTVMRFDSLIRPTYSEIREQMASLTSTVQENITGVRVVKAFNKQDYEMAKFAKENRLNYDKRIKAAGIRAFHFPLMEALGGLSALVVVWYGGLQVISGNLTVGQLVAFYSYIWALLWPIMRLGFLINFLEQALASGERVFEILDTRATIRSRDNAIALPECRGHVKFSSVYFDYGEQDVLIDINIDAKPGSTIALVGETGSGKTSIINLICRFYDVTRGSVTIDGYDVRNLDLHDLRRHIGIVQQDVFLFSASIKENIAFGRPDVSDEEIIAAAKAAQAHDFIMEMEDGYDTMVGERGIGLSGGQRQRVAIARALVTDPKILILDDATSSVDMETEFEIQKALSHIMKGRTTFIIAHRLSTIKAADEIIVLDKGRIVERGTHEQLLRKNGIYKGIYDVQFRDQESLSVVVADGSDT